MSRIDEALKRVAGTEKSPQDAAAPVAVEARSGGFEGTLDRYVAEKSTSRGPSPSSVRVRSSDGAIPQMTVRTRPPERPNSELQGKLVASRGISPVSVEQYRRLAATLHDLQQQRAVKSLMVSSAVPREGKTLTITNLALTLAESYQQRVLLVDADLRRPSIHDMFGVSIGTGLADVLRGPRGPLPVVEISSCLSILTAGHHDETSPLAQLTSERFPAVIEQATLSFDWILIDTPPIGLLPDAQHIARVCDGVLFVIAAGSTSYRLIQRSIAELGPERIVGTLLNRADEHVLSTHDYGGYYSTSGDAEAP